LVCPSTTDHAGNGDEGVPDHPQVVSDQEEQKNEAVKKRVALHGSPLIPEYLELSINLFTNTVLEQRHWKLDPDLCDKCPLPLFTYSGLC
jgi:hypothetical protein